MTNAIVNINGKLQQDGEWLRSLEENLKRSESLKKEIIALVKSFEDRLQRLDDSVVPLSKTTALLQRKQTNIRKILRTVDAMQQFYCRAAELESSIREGNTSADLDKYIERMDQLAEAISFFSPHPAYQDQLVNMKLTFESGCCALESEFRNVLFAESIVVDSAAVLNCLDQDYEVITARLNEMRAIRDRERVSRLAKWLLEKTLGGFVINTYAKIRADNILVTLSSVHHNESSNHLLRPSVAVSKSSTGSLKQVIRKATGRSVGPYTNIREWRAFSGVVETMLASFASFFALMQIEANIMKQIIADVSAEAKIQRAFFVCPLQSVIDRASKLLDENECSLIPLLPFLKHLYFHHNQLLSLADNSNGRIPYEAFHKKLLSRCMGSLDDFMDRLNNDPNKYIPEDGNVHQITCDTLNFLSSLMEYRQTVTQLLTLVSPGSNPSYHLPRLFARVLSALGISIRSKAENYHDETRSAIFLLNNHNYIHNVLQNDGMFPIVCEHNAQIRSFYQTEINGCMEQYLRSWNKVAWTIPSDISSILSDRHLLKNAILTFTTEFDKVINAQADYCISDVKLSSDMRNEVKKLICERYADFYSRISKTPMFKGLDKHLKYTPQSLDMATDRLFDVTS